MIFFLNIIGIEFDSITNQLDQLYFIELIFYLV
jgi:hypothetical protein